MGYMKAEKVLPTHLLIEVQKYIDGGLVYIPKKSKKVSWGSVSGSRKEIDERNNEIYDMYMNGISMDELADRYYLSIETIRKIVYGRKQL